MIVKNIFSPGPASSAEIVETLLTAKCCTVERIVSTGQATPPGTWYDQNTDEWVVLLSGSAEIRFEQEKNGFDLVPGDYLYIPAHTKHRVEWTEPDRDTVWLAVHINPAFRDTAAPQELVPHS